MNSLRTLDGVVPQGCPEPRRRPQSAQKIALILDKAPKHLQSDLVALVPKLVEQSEHPLAACALLDRLQKADAEPALRLPVIMLNSPLLKFVSMFLCDAIPSYDIYGYIWFKFCILERISF